MPGTRPGTTTVCVALQSQHRLGDDIALDLVRTTVDRNLAVVEITRRDLRGPIHRLVAAIVACWISEPLILSTDDAGLGLPLPCLPSSATTRSCVNSSAFSSISTAASFSRKP